MFKKENQIWLYLVGIIALFGLLIALTINFLIPLFRDPTSVIVNEDIAKPTFSIDTNLNYYARLTTNYGTLTIDLYEKNAPENVNNFIYLSKKGYYTRTIFHRLIKDFLLQGGDRNTLNSNLSDDGYGNPGYLIKDETNWDSLDLTNDQRSKLSQLGYSSTVGIESDRFERFSIGMASSGPNTNGSQFFIVIADNNDPRIKDLDGQFTNIGKVISGTEVLNNIKNLEVDLPDSSTPRPASDIIIESIEIYTN